MNELKCPYCGKVFKEAEADYASIVSQVKNAEFDQEFDKRIPGIAELRNTATELDAATDCFDKAIRKLIKTKEYLLSFENHLRLARQGRRRADNTKTDVQQPDYETVV